MKRSFYVSACVFALPLLAGAHASAASFQFSSLAYPGANGTDVFAINASDVVVGHYYDAMEAAHGFYWSNGTFTAVPNTAGFDAISDSGLMAGSGTINGQAECVTYDIGTGTLSALPVSLPGDISFSNVDAAGDVAGTAAVTVNNRGKYDYTGFVIVNGTTQTLLPPGQKQSEVFAGNQSGALAVGLGRGKAYVYQGGEYKAFSIPGIASITPVVLSSSGVLGGAAQNLGSNPQVLEGFMGKGKTNTVVAYPGAANTTVTGIGPAGQIVGYYVNAVGNVYQQGFALYKGAYTTIKPPGAKGAEIYGISAKGSVFGFYFTGPGTGTSFIGTCASGVCTK